MGVIKQKAPQKRDLKLPSCGGCEVCGDLHPDHLYILGHNQKYYCKKCFHAIAVKWPKPAPYKKPYKGENDGEGSV